MASTFVGDVGGADPVVVVGVLEGGCDATVEVVGEAWGDASPQLAAITTSATTTAWLPNRTGHRRRLPFEACRRCGETAFG